MQGLNLHSRNISLLGRDALMFICRVDTTVGSEATMLYEILENGLMETLIMRHQPPKKLKSAHGLMAFDGKRPRI